MEEIQSVEIRHLKIDDYKELKASMIDAYPNWPGAYWKESHLQKLLDVFPEGQIAVVVNGVVVGSALSLIIKYDHFGDEHTYKEITGNYTFNTHTPKGDVLYGIEVFIDRKSVV